jgi:8-oxo-dGTP pyrophosphatase MutT (NUDIX family)
MTTRDDAFLSRLSSRLLQDPPVHAGELVPDWAPLTPYDRPPVAAAVMIALVERPEGLTVLYTEVAFPGGKVDSGDADAAAAAVREANEEVGMRAEDVEILGYLPTYYTGTNYLITPVVARVTPSGPFVPNPGEVHSVFEVPLSRILETSTYGRFKIARQGKEHTTWVLRPISRENFAIW